MTFDYLPPSLYTFMCNLTEQHKLSMKEIKTMMIRKVAQDLGFDCDHSSIGYSPTKKPYCKRCWTRLTETKQAVVFKGKLVKSTEYEPVQTFLDQFYSYKEVRESKFERDI